MSQEDKMGCTLLLSQIDRLDLSKTQKEKYNAMLKKIYDRSGRKTLSVGYIEKVLKRMDRIAKPCQF